MADFSINDEQLQGILAQHILDSIGPETRDRLVQDALSFLMTAQEDPYNRKKLPSPLAAAFQKEVTKVAEDVVRQIIGTDKIKAQVEDAIQTVVKAWLKEHDYNFAPIVANALEKSLEISLNN
jgi:hypothetical protein